LTARGRAANLPAMELQELDGDERTALVGLVREVVMSDAQVSENEIEEVAEIVDALGGEGYQAAIDAFEARFSDEGAFRKFLATIKRQEARELIYGTILQGAAADAIEGGESELLSWLADIWQIEVQIEDLPEGSGGDDVA
jgi:Tellurite resistance protein TerB